MTPEEALMLAAEKLAAARVRFAQAFTIARIQVETDRQAHEVAVEQTQGEIALLEAGYAIAKHRMERPCC